MRNCLIECRQPCSVLVGDLPPTPPHCKPLSPPSTALQGGIKLGLVHAGAGLREVLPLLSADQSNPAGLTAGSRGSFRGSRGNDPRTRGREILASRRDCVTQPSVGPPGYKRGGGPTLGKPRRRPPNPESGCIPSRLSALNLQPSTLRTPDCLPHRPSGWAAEPHRQHRRRPANAPVDKVGALASKPA